MSRTVYHYRPDTTRDEPVIAALQAAAERYPRYGFPKLYLVLRRQGYPWNHKRLRSYRAYIPARIWRGFTRKLVMLKPLFNGQNSHHNKGPNVESLIPPAKIQYAKLLTTIYEVSIMA